MSKTANTIQKFKTVVKKYWYVAVPVHFGTSALWFGTLFGATKAGLDFVPALEMTSIPEKYIEKLKTGNVGNVAQAAILYKIITPVRYATTLAVTRSAIKYLRKRNLIK